MDLIAGRADPGAGGPPPNMGGPAPGGPDLASLLGAGGGPDPGAPQGQDTPGDPVDIVGQMLDLAKQYLDVEPDQEDKLSMQKVTTMLQQLLAKDQADTDNAMGGNLAPRTLRKALASPGPSPGGPAGTPGY